MRLSRRSPPILASSAGKVTSARACGAAASRTWTAPGKGALVEPMSKLARLLTFVLLAAFAAAPLASVADATAMTVKMSLMAMDDGADCENCSGDQDKAPLCDQGCMTSLPALPV